MRKITQQSEMVKNLRIGDTKLDTHRERERERHKEYNYIQGVQQLQNDNNNNLYKGYKLTLYSDSLRATTLYVLYINSLN